MNTRIALFLVVFSPFFQLYAQNETEPNNSFATANTIISGNTMTGNLLQTGGDTYDFFEGTLTPFGVLRVIITGTNQVSVANSVSMVGFFADQAQFSGFNTIFLPAGTGSMVTDTFYFECIAPGIVYFRMEANSYLNYELRFDVLGDLDFTEQEPNNTFLQANFLQEGDTAKGYISYGNGSGTYDGFDYYKATLNDYGTVEIYFEGININSSTVIPDFVTYYSDQGQASGFNYLTVPAYSTVADTFRYPCLSPGDYYFRVESNSCLKYRLSFRVIHTIQSNETEPNNSFANASLLMPGDTARGHITHSNGFGTNDQYDFWVIPVPVASQIKFHVSATETAYSGSSAIGFITFSKNQGQMAYKYINTNNLNTFLDSVIVDCYNQDTLYIRVEASGCHTYSIIPEVINRKPIAQFAYDRLGNNIGFRPMLDNITSMSWNFDDGTTSTSQFPLHNYPFGNWTPQLIAINSACNYSDTASTYFEISGVEYYTPHRSGQGGDISLRVFGGSLTSQTQVKLIQGSTILTPVESYANLESNVFNAIFDLHLADSGYYDLEIIIPGQTPVLYQNGFYVEGIRYPETYAEIIGPNRFLVGRDAPFRMVVGNKGNVNANGVVVGFAWPASVEVNLLHQRIRQPETGNMVVSENDTTYSLPYSETAFTYDSLNTVIQIDTLNGQPFSGFMRMIVIPHIPPGATYELPFTAKANSQGSTRFFVYTHRPNLFGSPTTPNWLDMIEGTAYEAIDYVDMAADGTKNVPLIVAAKTLKVGQKHIALAGKAAGARFWAWWDGYEVADETYTELLTDFEAANEFAMKTATNELRDQVLNLGPAVLRARNAEKVAFLQKRIAQNPRMSAELFSKYKAKLDKLNSLPDRMEELIKTTQTVNTLYEKLEKLRTQVQMCPDLAPQLRYLEEQLGGELHKPQPNQFPIQPVNSFDPNAIYGPIGVGGGQYVSRTRTQSFQISFENVDTATAAAQVVRIIDTLDVNAFDLSTFSFGDIHVGTHSIRVPKGRQSFVLDLRLDPSLDYMVRVSGRLDTVSGVVSWDFITLDTLTENIPFLDGFLPPNVNSPEGEGSVYYSILPKQALPSGTQIQSQASILFDSNPAINTNLWVNQTDEDAPASTMSASVVNDTLISLSLNGADAVSGVEGYRIFVSKNGEPFTSLFTVGNEPQELTGTPGDTYAFYCEAIDSAGNQEHKPALAEATVNMPVGISDLNEEMAVFRIQPNPNNGQFVIVTEKNIRNARLEVCTIEGKVVFTESFSSEADEAFPVLLDILPSGMYLVSISTSKGVYQAQRLLLVK